MSERLPQPGSGPVFIGDGGLEATMIFHEGFVLPSFASFHMLREPGGVDALRRYYRGYIDIAKRRGVGFTLDTPTWRTNADWGTELGYSDAALAKVNRDARRDHRPALGHSPEGVASADAFGHDAGPGRTVIHRGLGRVGATHT